jgi:hypothetical protein
VPALQQKKRTKSKYQRRAALPLQVSLEANTLRKTSGPSTRPFSLTKRLACLPAVSHLSSLVFPRTSLPISSLRRRRSPIVPDNVSRTLPITSYASMNKTKPPRKLYNRIRSEPSCQGDADKVRAKKLQMEKFVSLDDGAFRQFTQIWAKARPG